MRDSKEQLTRTTVFLHWIIALTVITLLAVGVYMKETETLSLYPIHKSIGVIIFFFVIIRVIWRVINGWPEPVATYQKLEQILAKITHWVLIVGTVIMPISGMLMSGASGYGINIFSVTLLATNPDPTNPEEMLPLSEPLASLGHELHEIIGYLMIAAVLLHICGALKHHIKDQDGTLRRMLTSKP